MNASKLLVTLVALFLSGLISKASSQTASFAQLNRRAPPTPLINNILAGLFIEPNQFPDQAATLPRLLPAYKDAREIAGITCLAMTEHDAIYDRYFQTGAFEFVRGMLQHEKFL